ncbi:hypothetical protein [Nonomuraea sp. NPDC003201]
MATDRHLTAVPDRDNAETPGGVPTAEALASFLRHLAGRRGRSGRITSPETVRAYTSALPTAFTGIVHLGELASVGRDQLHTNIRTARMLGQLLGRRTRGPIFLSARIAPDDGTAPVRDVDPAGRRRRMTYRTAERHLGAATDGWNLHDLRHSRLTHAGEDGATEADLMNLSVHEDRRTLQRYLKPSKEGAQRRLDGIEAQRGTWTPSADELADRMTTR